MVLPRRTTCFRLGSLALVLLGVRLAWAQSPTTEQRRSLEQLSLARARAELFEQLGPLRLDRAVSIAVWQRSDGEVRRALRLWVRTLAPEGPPRLYSDGICATDIHVSAEQVGDVLLELLGGDTETVNNVTLNHSTVLAAARRWTDQWATGRAGLDALPRRGRALGWEQVTREGLGLARRAASDDASAALAVRAGQLSLGEGRRLRGFIESSSAVRAAVQAELLRAATVTIELEPDPLALATARIDMRELLRLLTRVHQQHYGGEEYAVSDFRRMLLEYPEEELAARGIGLPPESTILYDEVTSQEFNAPAWVTETLRASGRYVPPDGEQLGAELQVAIARLDGIEQLQRDCAELSLKPGGVTVADFLAYHQDLKDDVVLFFSGARLRGESAQLPAGGCTVQIELPLERLWQILRRRVQLEETTP